MPKRVVNPLPGQPPKVKEAWRDGFEEAFWKYYGQNCAVPQEETSIYSWQDYRASQALHDHLKHCGVDRVQTQMPQDCRWDEFAGTFTENDVVHGLWAALTCNCGKYRNTLTRYRGTLSTLILGVVNASDGDGEVRDF